MKHLVRVLLFLLLPAIAPAQNTDSLLRVANDRSRPDTTRIMALAKVSETVRNEDIVASVKYAQQALDLATAAGEKGLYRGVPLQVLGTALTWNGQFDSAAIVIREAYDIYKTLGDEPRQASCLNGLGNAYGQLGNYPVALNSYFEALSIATRTGDKKRQSTVISNIANVYANRDDGPNAIKYYKQAIALKEDLEEYSGVITAYINMGGVYVDLGRTADAQDCSDKAMALIGQYGKKADSAFAMQLQGKIFLNLKRYPEALQKFGEARKFAEETGDIPSVVTAIFETGLVYTNMRDTAAARPYFDESFRMLNEMGEVPLIEDAYEAMADAYAEAGYHAESYRLLKILLSMEDTLQSKEVSELIAQKEAVYTKEKTQHELDNLKKNAEIGDLQLQRSRWLIIILVLAVLAVLMIVAFLFNRNRVKQLLNDQLEHKNSEITLQKKAITDSIDYAKKIQDSILPPDSLVHKIIPDSFILYLPKDVVSGDFYWVEQHKGLAVFAAVDCTGHGVPGALMSVIGFNLLTQAVNEMGLTTPSDILRHLDYGVNKLLRQSGDGGLVKDGMDLALCTLDPATRTLQYAGVFNPAYIVTKGELLQVKADKFPIGINTDGVTDNYTNHTMQLQAGDMIYLFSDGYPDQFGGRNGKKYMYNRFRQFLLSIHALPVEEQKQRLTNEFRQWRGNHEQVDDIIVIGVRVN